MVMFLLFPSFCILLLYLLLLLTLLFLLLFGAVTMANVIVSVIAGC